MDGRFIGMLVGALLIGALCGLGPLLAGRSRGRNTEGLVGFIVCIACGLILGIILAGPVALIWTIVLLTRPKIDKLPPP